MKLKRTKILLKSREHSEAFQKYAIERGCSWYNSKDVKHTDQPIICIDGYLMFSYSDDIDLFEYFDYQEITFESGDPAKVITGYSVYECDIETAGLSKFDIADWVSNKTNRKNGLKYDAIKMNDRFWLVENPNIEISEEEANGEFAAVLRHKAILYPKETK